MRRTPAWQPKQVFAPWTSPACASRRPPFGLVFDLGIQIIPRRCRGMILKSSFTDKYDRCFGSREFSFSLSAGTVA